MIKWNNDELNEITEDIESCLNDGYSLADLHDSDRKEVEGFIYAIFQCETAFDNLDCMMDDSIRGKIDQEIAQETWDHVYQFMIHSAVDVVYSIMDSEEYWEEDE